MYKYSSVPAYSMAPKPKPDRENKNPGPGNYELDTDKYTRISTHTHEPQWSFSHNQRQKDDLNPNPGPGRYDTPERNRAKGGYMGGKSQEKSSLNIPGPGAYEDKGYFFKMPRAPAYTMLKKGDIKDHKDVPGKIIPYIFLKNTRFIEYQVQDNMIMTKTISCRDNIRVKLFLKQQK